MKNSALPKKTEIEVGTGNFLSAELTNFTEKKCKFFVYRIDDESKKLGDKKEWEFRGREKSKGVFESDDYFDPRLSWFDEDEEEIKVALDISVAGGRVSGREQVLIIKRGDIQINLYWGEVTGGIKNSQVRVYAEYSKNVQVNSALADGRIMFPIFITDPQSANHSPLEDTFLGQPIRGHYRGNADYVSFSESLKNENKVDVVESRVINLNNFFAHFCSVTLKATIKGGHYKTVKYQKKNDISETKIFRRQYYFEGKDVLSFFQDQYFIPTPQYEVPPLSEYALDVYDTYEVVLDVYDFGKYFLEEIGPFLRGLLKGFLVKGLEIIAGELFMKYGKSLFKHKYYKEEINRALNYYSNRKRKRKADFESWFRLRNNNLTPHDYEYKKMWVIAAIKGHEITRGIDLRLVSDNVLSRYNFHHSNNIRPLIIIQNNWNYNYAEFKTAENATIKFLEMARNEAKYRMSK